MRAVIHRALIGLCVYTSRAFFKYTHETNHSSRTRHTKHIVSHRSRTLLDLLVYSMLGAADVYNLLPEYMVEASSTKDFQHRLQEMAVAAANEGMHDWQNMYSPRQALHAQTVKAWFEWRGRSKKSPVVCDGMVTLRK